MKDFLPIIFTVLVIVLLPRCTRTFTLENGVTTVPANSKVYKNKDKFIPSLLSQIDTSLVYEEFSLPYNKLARLANNYETEYYGVLRFYSNGYFNRFTVVRRDSFKPFDPKFSGRRGVYYANKNAIGFDLFESTSELGFIGKHTGEIRINGDTLMLYTKSPVEHTKVYIKRKELPWNLNYEANW